MAAETLRGQMRRQVAGRPDAGELWQEHGLVFTTTVGTARGGNGSTIPASFMAFFDASWS
jgi:hypothetical protein